jgi:hypothetical protein
MISASRPVSHTVALKFTTETALRRIYATCDVSQSPTEMVVSYDHGNST